MNCLKLKLTHLFNYSIAQLLIAFLTPAPALAAPITINPGDKVVSDLGSLISKGISAAIIIAALLTFMYLVWGGIEWLTSGGDKTKYEAARDRITAAVIGLAIVAAAWAIMKLIGTFFGINLEENIEFGNVLD